MEDEVFVSVPVGAPDLSCPPPGWGLNAWNQQSGRNLHHQQNRGRGGGHPTRVIRRTDLRTRGGNDRGHRQQKPPRFSAVQDKNVGSVHDRRKSWGEEWKPEPEMVEGEEKKMDKSDVLEQRLESKEEETGEDGEWKEVKGRRYTKTEEIKKSSHRKSPDLYPTRKKTPEPDTTASKKRSPESKNSNRKSPNFHSSKMSPEFPRPGKREPNSTYRKSPENYLSKTSDSSYYRKSPELENHRKTPDLTNYRKSPVMTNHRNSPELINNRKLPDFTKHKKSPDSVNHRKSPDFVTQRKFPLASDRKSPDDFYQRKTPETYHQRRSPEYNRRGSNSSNEGGDKSLVFRNKRRSPNYGKSVEVKSSPPRLSPTVGGNSKVKVSPPRLEKWNLESLESLVAEKDLQVLVPKIPNAQMVLASDLPDEQIARSVPKVRHLTEFEVKIRLEEEQVKVQKEIVTFLMENWQEVSNELNETEHEWPPKVAYYSSSSFV